MRCLQFGIALAGFCLVGGTPATASDPAGIHLNIEYPKDDHSGRLNVATGDGADSTDVRTPVVIIAPKPLLDYDRLYKKMMQGTPRAGGHATVEKDVLYNKKAAYSDPVSRRQLLFELLKDAEADLAFYRADYSEMQLLLSSLGS